MRKYMTAVHAGFEIFFPLLINRSQLFAGDCLHSVIFNTSLLSECNGCLRMISVNHGDFNTDFFRVKYFGHILQVDARL